MGRNTEVLRVSFSFSNRKCSDKLYGVRLNCIAKNLHIKLFGIFDSYDWRKTDFKGHEFIS